MNILFWIAGLAVNIYGWWRDFDESGRKLYYGKQEGTGIFRNDRSQLHKTTALFVFLIVEIGIGLSLIFLIGPLAGPTQQNDHVGFYSAVCWHGILGVIHFFIARGNENASRKNRVKQIAYRESIKKYLTHPEDFRVPLTVYGNNERWHTSLLPWVSAPGATADEGRANLAAALLEWAALPESNLEAIWHDLKYHPKV